MRPLDQDHLMMVVNFFFEIDYTLTGWYTCELHNLHMRGCLWTPGGGTWGRPMLSSSSKRWLLKMGGDKPCVCQSKTTWSVLPHMSLISTKILVIKQASNRFITINNIYLIRSNGKLENDMGFVCKSSTLFQNSRYLVLIVGRHCP